MNAQTNTPVGYHVHIDEEWNRTRGKYRFPGISDTEASVFASREFGVKHSFSDSVGAN